MAVPRISLLLKIHGHPVRRRIDRRQQLDNQRDLCLAKGRLETRGQLTQEVQEEIPHRLEMLHRLESAGYLLNSLRFSRARERSI